MTRILFVCHGNICRSPMAEFVMKYLAERKGCGDKFYIRSAATTREEIGNDIYPPAKRKLTAMHVPFEKRAARQMTQNDYYEFDYIIGMDRENLEDIHRICGNDPERKISLLLDWTMRKGRSVADPWYTGNFDITYDNIMEGCEALLKKLG